MYLHALEHALSMCILQSLWVQQVHDSELDIRHGLFLSPVLLLLLRQHRRLGLEHGHDFRQPLRQNFLSGENDSLLEEPDLDHRRHGLDAFLRDDAPTFAQNLGRTGIRTADFQLHSSEGEGLISNVLFDIVRILPTVVDHGRVVRLHLLQGPIDRYEVSDDCSRFPEKLPLPDAN